MPKHQNPRENLNARQEAFAQKVAAGSSQRQAYLDAGYTVATPEVADSDASTLVRNPKVAARIKELQRQNAIAAQVSVASVQPPAQLLLILRWLKALLCLLIAAFQSQPSQIEALIPLIVHGRLDSHS